MSAPTLLDQLLYSVKRIEVAKTNGSISLGTGYMCRVIVSERAYVFCVTNKHVVKGAATISLLMHTSDAQNLEPDGGKTYIKLQDQLVIDHSDEAVDLCAVLIGKATQTWEKENPGKTLYYKTLHERDLHTQEMLGELDVVEPVLMIGCPNGLWDEKNGFPLIRRGITASHPAYEFNGLPQFALDIGVYSGSSGSPVFLFESGLIKPNKTANTFSPGVRFGLIGTLWGGPRISEKGEVRVEPVPTERQLHAEIEVRMHIGYAIKSTKTIDLFRQIEELIKSNKKKSEG
jgi:hypothetical protein